MSPLRKAPFSLYCDFLHFIPKGFAKNQPPFWAGVETGKANNPNGEGLISADDFAPYPKNPFIAKFFIQPGCVDEPGSGVMNVNEFINEYAPGKKSTDIWQGCTPHQTI